jgi:hypothetical protein
MALELKEFFRADYPDLETAHILDFYKQGAWDSTWLKPLQDDGSWIVITQDLGKDPKKEKLPVLCRELGITHIAYTKAIIHGGYSIQKRALVAVWGRMREVQLLPRGTHVRLGITTLKGGVERYDLQIKKDGIWKRL